MTISLLGLSAQHIALQQELMQEFCDALDSDHFEGGTIAEAFEKARQLL